MLILSSPTRSVDYGETSFDDTNITDSDGRKISHDSIIEQANKVSFVPILQSLNFKVDKFNRSIRCLFHKDGNERTTSLWFYLDSNRFYCFGCKKTGRPVDFISLYKKVSRINAALFIIEHFEMYMNSEHDFAEIKSALSDEIIISFSNQIRTFLNKNASQDAMNFAEKLCFSFDKINQKHNLNREGLVSLISKLRSKLEMY